MTVTRKTINQIALPGLIGNVLEWYDFALYGYFAAVISPLFFPTTDIILSLMATFAVFAVGFIMRPLGAILFGYYGDRFGRKNALAAAILLMAIPTTLIGCLPTHAQIGMAAGVLLTLLRLLQGLAVGGEFTGSIVYISEHAPEHRRGFYGSLAMSSAFAGLVLGSGVAAVTGMIAGDTDLQLWAWRIPFLISIVLGGIGLYLRMGMPESPMFLEMIEERRIESKPIRLAFTRERKKMLMAIGVVFLPSMGFYMSFVYLTTHLTVYLDYPLQEALEINTITMSAIMFIIPIFGQMSDKYGRKFVMRLGAIGFMLLSLPAYMLLEQVDYAPIFIAQIIFAILVALSYSAVPAALVEYFPSSVRYTGLSFPYNMANALFGGTAPFIATFLIYITGKTLAPCFALIIGGLVTQAVLRRFPETLDRDL